MPAESYNIDPELLAEFLDESIDSLAPLENILLELEAEPTNLDLVNKLFRPIHSLKGNASFFGMMRIKDLSHKMENLLDLVRKDKVVASKDVINALLPGVDTLKTILQRVRSGAAEIADEEEFKAVLATIERAVGAEKVDLVSLFNSIRGTLESVKSFLPADRVQAVDTLLGAIDRFTPPDKKGASPSSPKVDSTKLPVPLMTVSVYVLAAASLNIAIKPMLAPGMVSDVDGKLGSARQLVSPTHLSNTFPGGSVAVTNTTAPGA